MNDDRLIKNMLTVLGEERIPVPPELDDIRSIMVWVKCPHCGKKYTRATAGSTVEVACRGCKEVTVVALIAA